MGGSFYAGQASVEPMTFGAVNEAKQKLLDDNVEQYTRLKEAPVWDISVVTAEEMTQAYINVSKAYNVTAEELKTSGGNLQLAIQGEMAKQSVLCNNSKTNQL